jgi:microcystin degradation protein MlrC
MRIAIAGMAIESCTFSPLITTLGDFTLWRENDLLARYPFLAAYSDITFVPLLAAHALPGGVVAHAAYQQMTDEILHGLARLGPFQGVYLDMHGAMAVEGLDDAEADFFAAVRAVAGREALLSASYDLHGNVSEQIMRELDLLTAYRTAPHTDVEETRARGSIAGRLPSRRHPPAYRVCADSRAFLRRTNHDDGRAGAACLCRCGSAGAAT